eukprot:TRINITY_DN9205_c0_g2_i3.p1 TRINITY_DN9205_c0_g2~~TRINITY_DN9205_c0_g2_i3.p1  ORF type:complete len:366 (-),score=108.38 TRINITY_DN9205_c0_g2_i3:147-1115(-)
MNVAGMSDDESNPDDPWKMLDPHDNSKASPHPFKKGKTYSAPASAISLDSINEVDREKNLEMVLADPIQVALSRSVRAGSVRVPFYVEFAEIYAEQVRAEKKQRAQRKKPKSNDSQNAMLHADQDLDDLDDDEGADQFMPLGDFPPIQHVDQWDLHHDADQVEVESEPSSAELDQALMNFAQPYEELVRDHVESYVSSAQVYLMESKLSRRVAAWQARLEPILEEQEAHPPFDIHAYGQKLIHKLCEEPEASDEKAPAAETQVAFDDLVQGETSYDICRLFLASLQLANNGNVEIVPGNMSMSLKLLSAEQVRPQLDDACGH